MGTVFKAKEFEVRPAERRLLAHGQPVSLGGRAFDLLVAFIELRDRVASKDELLARVWPGAVVEENNLTVQISSLRKVLGPDAIATVAGRGYRFTLPLLDDGAPASPAEYCPIPRRSRQPELRRCQGNRGEAGAVARWGLRPGDQLEVKG